MIALQMVIDDVNIDLKKLYFMQSIVCKIGGGIENCRITRCGYTGNYYTYHIYIPVLVSEPYPSYAVPHFIYYRFQIISFVYCYIL